MPETPAESAARALFQTRYESTPDRVRRNDLYFAVVAELNRLEGSAWVVHDGAGEVRVAVISDDGALALVRLLDSGEPDDSGSVETLLFGRLPGPVTTVVREAGWSGQPGRLTAARVEHEQIPGGSIAFLDIYLHAKADELLATVAKFT